MFLGYRDENVVNMLTDIGVEAVIVWTQLPNLVEVVKHNINAFGVSSNTMRVSSSDRSLSSALNSLYNSMRNFASSTEGETFFFFSIILSVIKIL